MTPRAGRQPTIPDRAPATTIPSPAPTSSPVRMKQAVHAAAVVAGEQVSDEGGHRRAGRGHHAAEGDARGEQHDVGDRHGADDRRQAPDHDDDLEQPGAVGPVAQHPERQGGGGTDEGADGDEQAELGVADVERLLQRGGERTDGAESADCRPSTQASMITTRRRAGPPNSRVRRAPKPAPASERDAATLISVIRQADGPCHPPIRRAQRPSNPRTPRLRRSLTVRPWSRRPGPRHRAGQAHETRAPWVLLSSSSSDSMNRSSTLMLTSTTSRPVMPSIRSMTLSRMAVAVSTMLCP